MNVEYSSVQAYLFDRRCQKEVEAQTAKHQSEMDKERTGGSRMVRPRQLNVRDGQREEGDP